jgi:hypothetical protein
MRNTAAKLKPAILSFSLIIACSVIALAREPLRVGQDGKISAAEALVRYEKVLQGTTDQLKRFYLMTRLTPAALAAGETEKAKSYALILLQQAATLPNDWNYGNAIEVGNIVLGLIALKANDVTEAKRLLLESASSPGSPQMNSFGPNMLLAKELLAKGERAAVIEYFGFCAKFWKMDRGRLAEWKAVAMEGGIPDFGANLAYEMDSWRIEKWAKLGY